MSTKIKLERVRLSFPSVFKTAIYEGEDTGKYTATFLIPKAQTKIKQKLDQMIEAALKEAKLKAALIPADNFCLRDGDDILVNKDGKYDSFEGHWVLKAGNSKRPTVINKDKSAIIEEDEIIYGGCWVNGIIDIWIQNNKWGKRVNANLHGIQFVKDDEPFGAGPIDVTDEFDDIDVDEL